jgi:hypothetical protein
MFIFYNVIMDCGRVVKKINYELEEANIIIETSVTWKIN